MLAELYFEGEGVTQDAKESLHWHRKAAEQGNASSQLVLADWYNEGDLVPKNEKEAFKWMLKAAQNGNHEAQLKVGLYYAIGLGHRRNSEEAAYWYRKSADNDNSIAQFLLGLCYVKGCGVKPNYNKATEWFCRTAEQFSMVCDPANPEDYVGLMLDAGIKADPLYLTVYGVLIDSALGAEEPTLNDNAVKKAENGDIDMQYLLGIFYMTGFGVDKNTGEALKWFRKASKLGSAKAKSFLDIYDTNDTERTAFEWFREASNQGNSDAMIALGLCHSIGIGIPRDEQMAMHIYLKAAEQDNARAQFFMAIRYFNGLGVEKNEGKGQALFDQSLKNKYDKALLIYNPSPEMKKILNSVIKPSS